MLYLCDDVVFFYKMYTKRDIDIAITSVVNYYLSISTLFVPELVIIRIRQWLEEIWRAKSLNADFVSAPERVYYSRLVNFSAPERAYSRLVDFSRIIGFCVDEMFLKGKCQYWHL